MREPVQRESVRRKASFSRSPLAHSATPIYALATQFQDFLHLPDPSPLYVVMGALAANMMQGQPVWLMLIGESSCGKTELLMTLKDVPGIHITSKIKGEQALLSGTKKKEYAKGAKGGLLREIGDRGALVFKDFTTILSMQKDGLGELLSAFREVYDGEWGREIGGEGGQTLKWKGHIGFLTGVTPAVDRSHAMVSEMGERFIFFRYPDSDGWAEAFAALGRTDMPQMSADIRVVVKDFFEGFGLDWSQQIIPRQLTHAEKDGVIAMGQLAGRSRGLVLRDSFTKDIIDIPSAERPTRVTLELGMIYRAMEYLGVQGGVGGEAWKITQKIALDSMPMVRSIALRCAVENSGNGYRTTRSEIADRGMFSDGTAGRALEELMALKVMRNGGQGGGGWQLTERAQEMVKRGFQK